MDLSQLDLKLHESLLVAIAGSLGMAVLVYDQDDLILHANSQVREFVDIPAECLKPGKPLGEVLGLTYDSKKRFSSAGGTRTALTREQWVESRLSIHRRDWYDQVERLGQGRWVRFICRRTLSGMGITLILDVTESKRQEQTWQSDIERVKMTEDILDTLPTPLFVKNRNLVYIAVNKAFCDLHSMAPEAALGHSVWDLVDPEVAEQIEAEDRKVLETGVPYETQEVLNTPAVSGLHILTRKYRIGKPGHYMLVTLMDDMSRLANRGIIKLARPDEESGDLYKIDLAKPAQEDLPEVPARPGQPVRILVLFEDLKAGNLLAGLLSRTGVEACAVARPAEFSEFMTVATIAGLQINMLVTDRYSIKECIPLLEAYHLQVMVVEDPGHHAQILTGIRERLLARQETAQHQTASPLGARRFISRTVNMNESSL